MKIRAALLSALALAGIAEMSGLAQAPPPDALRYTTSFTLTGNYTAAGSDLPQGTIHFGTNAANTIPVGADIVTAFLYWETISVASPGGPPNPKVVADGATFRNVPLTALKASTVGPLPLNPSSCLVAGKPVYLTNFRADVLNLLPPQRDLAGRLTGKYIVNDADLPSGQSLSFTLPDKGAGNNAMESAGATLVVVWRDPAQPLRRIVLYDGASPFSFQQQGQTTNQIFRGFYQTATPKVAQFTAIAGTGAKNSKERILINNQVAATNPFPDSSQSSERSWANPTINVSSYMSANTTTSTFGEQFTVKIDHTNSSPYDCLSVAGWAFSATVPDVDHDGIPDRLESPGAPLSNPDGMPLPDLYGMGARPNHQNIFFEILGLYATPGTSYGNANAPYYLYDTLSWPQANGPTKTDNAGHNHVPPPAAIKMWGDAYKNAPVANPDGTTGIKALFDVGKLADYRAQPYGDYSSKGEEQYLVPDQYARGGETVRETTVAAGQFPAYPGTVGFPVGARLLMVQPVDPATGAALQNPDTTCNELNADGTVNAACRRRVDGNRDDIFHVMEYVHSRGTPKSLPCLDAQGKPIDFNPDGTCTTANPSYNTAVPTTSSGVAHLPGSWGMVSLGGWDDFTGTTNMIAATSFHEAGHQADLWHGGGKPAWNNSTKVRIVEPNCKPNYLSSMSYLYQLRGLQTNGGKFSVDYSRQVLGRVVPPQQPPAGPLVESSLLDGQLSVISGPSPLYRTAWYTPFVDGSLGKAKGTEATKFCNGGQFGFQAPNPPMARVEGSSLAAVVDWNGGTNISNPIDVNFDGPGGATSFGGFNDWANVRIDQVGAGVNMAGLSKGGQDYSGQDYSGQDYSGQDYSGQNYYGGQPFGGQDYSGQDFGQDYSGQNPGGQDYSGQDYSGQDYSGQDYSGQEPDPAAAASAGADTPNDFTACVIDNVTCVGTPTQFHRIRLDWTRPNAGTPTRYHVFRVTGPTSTGPQAELPNSPTPGFSLVDEEELPNGQTFTYLVRGEFGAPPLGSAAEVTVTAVNAAPVAANIGPTMFEDGTLVVPLATFAADADSPLLGIDGRGPTLVGAPLHGAVQFNPDGSFTYVPVLNFNGTDSFTYKIVSGTWSGPPSQKMSADSGLATVNIRIYPVNDQPTANGQSVTTNEDVAKGITLTASDVESVVFTTTITQAPGHGQVTGSWPNFTYTPAPNYNGPDSFKFTVTDRGDPDNCAGGPPNCSAPLSSAEATVAITVYPVNDAPTASGQSVTTSEDTPKAIVLTASDVETSSANLSATIVQPLHGSVTGSWPNYTYTPAQDYNGPDNFTFTVTDRGDPDNCGAVIANVCTAALTSSSATVLIAITEVNDAPVPQSDSPVTTPEDTPIDIDVLANDARGPATATDEAGQTLTLHAITIPPTHGAATIVNNQVHYAPDHNYNGPDGLTYEVCDDGTTHGTPDPQCATEAVTITVTPVNDDPVAGDDTASTGFDTPVTITVLTNDTDVDGDTPLTIDPVFANETNGTAVRNSNNTVTFTPTAGFTGVGSFDYTLLDGHGGSDTGHATVTVGHVKRGPDMASLRRLHSSTLASSGLVLIAGGEAPVGVPLSSSELYDPITNSFSAGPNLAGARADHVAVALNNGAVLVAGGWNGSAMSSAELYDSSNNQFVATGSMAFARQSAAAVRLTDGRVLVTGGVGSLGFGNGELYDPNTGTFASAGSLNQARHHHTMTVLTDGRVLIVGGLSPSSPLGVTELYDPATGLFTTTGSLTTPRSGHVAALLPNGKVLIAGGVGASGQLASAELYDPAAGTFSAAGTMTAARTQFTATSLADGKVLLAGGGTATLEVYDPVALTFTAVDRNMTDSRIIHAASLLPDGKVLITGGYNGLSLKTTDLYKP